MSKRKGQNNGSNTRNQTSPAASGNAPEIDAAGAALSSDGAAMDTASIVDGSNGVDGAADGKGLNDGGRKELPVLEAGEGAAPGADKKTADTGGENVPVGIGAGSGSGSIENDGDASADGAADGGQDGSVSGEGNDQAGSVGGGNSAGSGDGGGSSSGDDNNLEHVGDGNKDENAGSDDADGSAGSPDLKAALELAGCETTEDLVDMARIGANLIIAIEDIRRCEGPFSSWQPMDDPTEIVHDLYAALEHAWEKTAAPATDQDGNPASSEAPPDVDCCPVCAVPFKPDDVCATDIEMGTCHAECLAGTPVVDLDTGAPSSGPVDTFLYSDWVTSCAPAKSDDRPWWLTAPNFSKDIDPREISHSFAYDVFRGVHGSVETAGVVINGGGSLFAFADEPAISFEAVSELVDLVRRIGPRATPDVLAQHLVITKHRQSAELTKAEELGLKAFAAILIDLDDYTAAEKKRLEDLAAEKPKPRPVPIEDTTMETVDDPMARW